MSDTRGSGVGDLFLEGTHTKARPVAILPQPSRWRFLGRKFRLSIGAGEGNRTLVISLEGCLESQLFQSELILLRGQKPLKIYRLLTPGVRAPRLPVGQAELVPINVAAMAFSFWPVNAQLFDRISLVSTVTMASCEHAALAARLCR
jgi:hypothetical protein